MPRALLLCALLVVSANAQQITPEREAELFSQIDQMVADVEEITGFEALKPIPRALISKEEINELVTKRLDESDNKEQFRLEELFLYLFGLTDKRLDLESQVIDVLTEQAAALYDYKTKQLYLATWAPPDMQEYALVHEIAHALADQHFDLEEFVTGGGSADGDLARMAVIEGQASWVMTDWVMRKTGRSLADSPLLAAAAVGASRHEVENYPVFSSSPRYIQETMMFPYTTGLLFQQAAVEALGEASFARVFARPPSSTRHIIDPDSYLKETRAETPSLLRVKLKRFKRSAEGDIGQLDHAILLSERVDEKSAKLAQGWRGANYEIWENRNRSRAVLLYASQWASESDARRFFNLYQNVCQSKWKSIEIDLREKNRIEGRSEAGRFVITLDGRMVASAEALPDDTVVSNVRKRKRKP